MNAVKFTTLFHKKHIIESSCLFFIQRTTAFIAFFFFFCCSSHSLSSPFSANNADLQSTVNPFAIQNTHRRAIHRFRFTFCYGTRYLQCHTSVLSSTFQYIICVHFSLKSNKMLRKIYININKTRCRFMIFSSMPENLGRKRTICSHLLKSRHWSLSQKPQWIME